MTDPLVPDRCLICDTVNGYELVTREDEHIVRHGIRFTVAGLKWYECRACHEVINTPTIVDANAMLIDAAYAARRKVLRIENNLLDPASIKTIRKKLGETQESLSMLLGVGSNGLQKYETDKSCPSKPAELLLRVLAVQPSYLSTLKLIAAMPASSFAQPDQPLTNCEILVTLDNASDFGNWGAFGSVVPRSITEPTLSALTDGAYITSAKAETQGCHYVH